MPIAVGKKIGMTQVENGGKFVGVSAVLILPAVITQIKNKDNDGYNAVQLGIINLKRKAKLKKPQLGHLKKTKVPRSVSRSEISLRERIWLRQKKVNKFKEFRIIGEGETEFKVGEKLDVSLFGEGDRVSVSGMSLGRGFQGVIKRHHFHRGPKTHGSDHHRAPGSIGMCSFPSRVFKGKKMPGRDGVKRTKIKNLRIIKFIKDKSLLLLHGSVPGKKESYLGIKLTKKFKPEVKDAN